MDAVNDAHKTIAQMNHSTSIFSILLYLVGFMSEFHMRNTIIPTDLNIQLNLW